MLALILAAAGAAAVGADSPRSTEKHLADMLKVCDTPKLMQPCGNYLRGFVDALQAREDIAEMARRSGSNVQVQVMVCFGGGYDIQKIWRASLVALKDSPPNVPARMRVLSAITSLYPCDAATIR